MGKAELIFVLLDSFEGCLARWKSMKKSVSIKKLNKKRGGVCSENQKFKR